MKELESLKNDFLRLVDLSERDIDPANYRMLLRACIKNFFDYMQNKDSDY